MDGITVRECRRKKEGERERETERGGVRDKRVRDKRVRERETQRVGGKRVRERESV